MRFLRGVLGLSLIACSLLAVADTAQAGRRSGMAGSLLIEDKDDLFFFPQLLPQYRNLIALDYGGAASAGNAVLTLGDEDMAWGVALHRGDVMTPHVISELAALNGPASLFGAPFTAAGPPATLVDFLFGTSMGGDSQLGLRIGLGHGSQYASLGNDDTGESEMFLMGEVGYGWGERGESTRVDLSGALTLDFGSAVAGGMDDASGTHIGVSGLLRAFVPMEDTLDLGWLGNVAVASNSVTDQMAAMEPSDSTLAFTLGGGVGPAFRFGNASVAGYGIARFLYQSNDPNSEADDDANSAYMIVIPGVHVAAEVPLNDWLYVRTGAEYAWNINGTSDDGGGPDEDDDMGTSATAGAFGWNAGLGVVIDDFRFDGSLQHGFVTGGPDFIGGTGPGFFMIASLSYAFDNARRGVVKAEEEDAEAAPPPEPPPAPPVLQPAPPPPPPPPPAPVPENPEAGIDVGASGGVQFQTTPAPAAPPPQPPPAPVR
jgi:hypothetical protein